MVKVPFVLHRHRVRVGSNVGRHPSRHVVEKRQHKLGLSAPKRRLNVPKGGGQVLGDLAPAASVRLDELAYAGRDVRVAPRVSVVRVALIRILIINQI